MKKNLQAQTQNSIAANMLDNFQDGLLMSAIWYVLTRMAIFLSLFIAENCFKRDNTAESRGLSGATPST